MSLSVKLVNEFNETVCDSTMQFSGRKDVGKAQERPVKKQASS